VVLEEEEDFFCDADEGELSEQGQVSQFTFLKFQLETQNTCTIKRGRGRSNFYCTSEGGRGWQPN